MVREIFKSHDLIFSGRPVLYAAKKLSYDCLNIVFAPYGEYWKEIRKIAVLELLSANKVQSFETARKEEVALTIASIESSQGPIDLSKILVHLVNNIVSRVAFGRKYEEGKNGKTGIHEFLPETTEILGGFSIADFFPWLRWIHKLDGLESKIGKNFQRFDKFYDEIIQEHLDPKRLKPQVEDLVDVMLRIQRDPTQKMTLTTNHIKGVLTDMFIAGTDTSSVTLIWIMTELIKNPAVMKKAQEEVRNVVDNKGTVEESDLPHLNYIKLVVTESLRLHPPSPLLVPRETTETCTFRGYEIPAKTRVFINETALSTDLGSWVKPDEFLPERFPTSFDFRRQDYDFIPFGIGRRGCPGINFSLVLIELVLANLLHHFNWDLPNGVKRKDVDTEEAFGLALHKKTPLYLVATLAKPCKSS
ncbi:hypothetical protein ACHQM5_010971 [Ranunculus cassubicifolius]